MAQKIVDSFRLLSKEEQIRLILVLLEVVGSDTGNAMIASPGNNNEEPMFLLYTRHREEVADSMQVFNQLIHKWHSEKNMEYYRTIVHGDQ